MSSLLPLSFLASRLPSALLLPNGWHRVAGHRCDLPRQLLRPEAQAPQPEKSHHAQLALVDVDLNSAQPANPH
jgi:hypothetical protein